MGTLYAIKGNIINSQEPLPIPVDFMTKLWENPDPTADFAQQQVTLSKDATNYDFLMIELKYRKNADYRFNVIGHTGNNIILSYGECGSKGAQVTQRNLYLVSGSPNKVLINDCELAAGATASTTSNDHCIPIAIYGFNTQVPMQSGGGGTKYDPKTDMLYLWDGTKWVEWKKAGLNDAILYDNGVFNYTYKNGVYRIADNISSVRAFDLTANRIKGNLDSVTGSALPTAYTLVFDDLFDFSNYSSIEFDTNFGTLSLDISGVSNSGYVCIGMQKSSSGTAPISYRLGIASSKQDFDSYWIGSNLRTTITGDFICYKVILKS